jgi:hypothetical protein
MTLFGFDVARILHSNQKNASQVLDMGVIGLSFVVIIKTDRNVMTLYTSFSELKHCIMLRSDGTNIFCTLVLHNFARGFRLQEF